MEDRLLLAGARVVHFDVAFAVGQHGLSVRLERGKMVVTLGEERIRPDAVWWWEPIGRERDGLVSAAVQPLIDPDEVILAEALRRAMTSPSVELLGDLAHRAVLRHIAALETAFPEDIYVNPCGR